MKIRKAAILLFALLLSGCYYGDRDTSEETEEPESVVGVTEIELELPPPANEWYVATTGDDANSCATPEEPCLTLDRAYAKTAASDRINMAAGTYLGADGTGELLPHLTHSIVIRGAGSTETIIDSNDNSGGSDIRGDNHLYLEGLTIRNVAPRACLKTLENAGILAQDVVLQNCANGGLKHLSTGLVELVDVDIIGTSDSFGISSGGGQLLIFGGEISGNSEGGVSSGGQLIMSSTTVRGNGATGVWVGGTATLTDVNISGHSISPGEWPDTRYSGLLIKEGTATVIDTNIIENQFGISVISNSSLTMLGGTVSSNTRTGIQIDVTSEATFEEATISDNASWYAGTDLGGGFQNSGELTIIASLIENNHNGGILNMVLANLEMVDSTVRGNHGWLDGIYNSDTAVATIDRSLIAGNRGEADGIENRGTMTIANSTITGNQNNGISATGVDLSLSFVTIARNGEVGLGAGNFGAGISLIESVLIAENGFADCSYFSSPIGSNPLVASLRFAGTSVDSDATCRFPETFSPAELRIGTLADNGGRTWTLALDPASEAVDIVDGACLDEDQRKFIRPVGISCDAGAYETGAGTLTLEDPGFIIGTPTPEQPGTVTIITTVPCFGGPGPGYVYHSTLQQGNNLQLVGAGFTGGANDAWIVARHPQVPNPNCWIPSQDVNVDIPVSDMLLITIPGLPTATPRPTSDRPAAEDTPVPCYYNINNILICP